MKKLARLMLMLTCFCLLLMLTACGAQESQKPEAVQSETCFIYTDGLLDDLCAIEYLSDKYDNAIIMLHDPDGLAGNPYAAGEVTDEKSFYEAVSGWYAGVTPYSDGMDISGADFYLLGPLTDFAELLKNDRSLESHRALLMAGDSDGPDGAGKDWNAVMDIDAYMYVTGNMTDLVQMTRPDCENEYEANGYPFEAQFLDEYTAKMKSMNENLCCYDLQAVALFFREAA